MFRVGDKSHTSQFAKVTMATGLENPMLKKKKTFLRCKENSKVIMVFKAILKKSLPFLSLSNNRTSTHFASEHAKRFQK